MRTVRRTATFAVVSLTLSIALPTAARAQEAVDYVALGDSYSSGTGTGSYTDAACKRSDLAYPALLAAELGAELTFAACSGAYTADLIAEQADALDEGTDLVTLTVGGNDIDWNEALVSCMVPLHDCTGDVERSERLAEDELPDLLDAAYTAIGDRAPHAEVYVLGYPRLFAAENTCDAFGLLSVAEQRRANRAADVLSEVIEAAALAHGFTYIDVRDDFEGHAVCDDDPWLHGLTYPVGDSYHPGRAGHARGYLPALLAAL
ncbi:SGNH/GDSL hydrolase family protein [Glycomyces arizonensis]|uniref:SGNH/GDSL hydrolase family protein n=1 Tax=Glycomyces arizonensis TaxID=256035 RepID=UPI00042118B0|nr:SGNH/GDSL hydrolase family protein [Glycomyces arizonensis]